MEAYKDVPSLQENQKSIISLEYRAKNLASKNPYTHMQPDKGYLKDDIALACNSDFTFNL